MNTLTKNYPGTVSGKTVDTKLKSISRFWENAEFNRFGITPILLAFIACMGGIAAGFGTSEYDFELLLVIFPTGAVLVSMLAVTPMRVILKISLLAFIIDLLVLIF